MGESRLTRRTLLRSVAVAAGGAGVGAALPGVALADSTAPVPAPTSTMGADAPGEVGAGLTGMQGVAVVPPVGLTITADPAPRVPVTAAVPSKNFLRYDFELRQPPPELQPYALASPARVGYGTVDASGVRMVLLQGKLWNHPTGQAQYGITMLESYRLTADRRYLTVALAQAQRLISRARAYSGALFHPYDFADRPHGTAVRTAPWYSGMAQGQVLDFFTRLYRVTGDLGHKAEADGTFRAFLVPQVAGKPWVAWVYAGLLWLDEYPRTDIASGDRTYNGHMFASFGLYQYYLLTKDERARQLVQGAFSTARSVAQQVRNPGWRSVYCLQDRADSGNYHPTHSMQHLLIATITGDPSFAGIADTLSADFPSPKVAGTVVFGKGTHVGYVFSSTGQVTRSRSIAVTTVTSAPCTARTKIAGRAGLWYLISAGTLSGYYVQEVVGSTYVRGSCLPVRYLPYRNGTLTQDVATAVQPPAVPGGPLPTRQVNLVGHGPVLVGQRLTINAVEYLGIVAGPNAGWWVPAAAVQLWTAPGGTRNPP